jgi:hypothetical protein
MDPPAGHPPPEAIESGDLPECPTLTSSPRPGRPDQPCHEIQEQLLVSVPGPHAGDQDPESTARLLARIAKPGWAEERALALVRTGATMPKIVEHLVAKGVSREAAEALALKAFEDRIRIPQEQAARRGRIHRILFHLVGCSLIVLECFIASPRRALVRAILISLLVAVSWLPSWLHQERGFVLRWLAWAMLFYMMVRFHTWDALWSAAYQLGRGYP